jgi:hypothetical protein
LNEDKLNSHGYNSVMNVVILSSNQQPRFFPTSTTAIPDRRERSDISSPDRFLPPTKNEQMFSASNILGTGRYQSLSIDELGACMDERISECCMRLQEIGLKITADDVEGARHFRWGSLQTYGCLQVPTGSILVVSIHQHFSLTTNGASLTLLIGAPVPLTSPGSVCRRSGRRLQTTRHSMTPFFWRTWIARMEWSSFAAMFLVGARGRCVSQQEPSMPRLVTCPRFHVALPERVEHVPRRQLTGAHCHACILTRYTRPHCVCTHSSAAGLTTNIPLPRH